MNTTLEQKVFTLVEDIEPLDRHGRAKALIRFIENELQLGREQKFFDAYDLTLIQSRAVGIMAQEPVHSDLSVAGRERGSEFMRVACYVQATVEFLRSRNLLSFWVGFRRTHRKPDTFEYCRHPEVAMDAGELKCKQCGQIVVPVMYAPKSERKWSR